MWLARLGHVPWAPPGPSSLATRGGAQACPAAAFERPSLHERHIAVLKFLDLVLKNLRRNRVRTLLTGLAVLILATIYSVVSNATAFIGELVDNAADTRLVIREKWITPSRIPMRYARLIAGIPGVEDWTLWQNYVGYLDKSHRVDRRGWGVATRMNNLREMHPGLEKLDPALLDQMSRERTARWSARR